MLRGSLGILLLLLIVGATAGAWAQGDEDSERLAEALAGEPFTITADQVSYAQGENVLEASGNVRIEQEGGRTLEADWVTYNPESRIGVAVGNVRIRAEGETMTAEFATVDFENLQALATDATLLAEETGFVVRGEALEKTGPDTFRAAGARFTTCGCKKPDERLPWEVEAAKADVRVEGYAVARHVRFRILDVPVFYTPYLILPVKTKRQTGFLLPDFGRSNRNGAELELPFFWAAREDTNVLLRPRWMSDRGLKAALDFERVFGEEGYSNGGGAILPNDDDVDRNDPDTDYSHNRWAFWLRHEQPFARGIRFGADVERASDNDYPLDFDEDLGPAASHDRFLEADGWLSAARHGLYGGVVLGYADDLQNPNQFDRDQSLLQRLPDVRAAALPRKLGPVPLFASFDTRYTYFYNKDADDELFGVSSVGGQFFDTGVDGLFDADEPDGNGDTGVVFDPSKDNFLTGSLTQFEGDGVFQEGELLSDRGHRVDIQAYLTLPVQLGIFEFVTEGGLRETLYSSKYLNGETRTLWNGRADLRTRFVRDFEIGGLGLTHVLEPQVTYSFITPENQSRNPLFIPASATPMERLTVADPRLLSRDPSDRIDKARLLQLSLGNRIFGLAKPGRPARQIAEFRLFSGYDFERGRVTNIYLESTFEPSSSTELGLVWGYDSKENEIDEVLVRLAWEHSSGLYLGGTYRYLRDIPLIFEKFKFDRDYRDFDSSFNRVNQIDLDAHVPVSSRLDLFMLGNGSFEDGNIAGTAGFVLHSSCKCWDILFSAKKRIRPDDTSVQFQIRLAGLGMGIASPAAPNR
jgi:lipopolysaccharide assembly outer membrane protein LptD (OstA)